LPPAEYQAEGEQQQNDATRNLDGRNLDMNGGDDRPARPQEQERDNGRHHDGAQRDGAFLRRVHVLGHAGIDDQSLGGTHQREEQDKNFRNR
jgi:hypothetical protein